MRLAESCRPMRILMIALMFSVLLNAPAFANRPWYHTAHAGKPYVNPDLVPTRVIGKVADASWDGQLVLWQGRIRSFERKGREGKETMVGLDVGGQLVPVHFRGPAINLEVDRTGYRVAIKGYLQIKDGALTGVDGKSIILLQPPGEQDYAAFLKANPTLKQGIESFLAWRVGFHNPQYSPALRAQVAAAIVRHARENDLDPLLLAALIQIESAYRIDIVSPSGAIGLGQLMPFTARGFGVDPWKPDENVKASARMISGLIRSWQGTDPNPRALALAGYNAGPTRVRTCHGIPAIPQTTNYVYFIGYVHNDMTSVAARLGLLAIR